MPAGAPTKYDPKYAEQAANGAPCQQSNAAGEVGRPTAYDKSFAEQAQKLCVLGATDDEIADFFNVHRATIYRWKHTHPEFCDAIRIGKDVADERVRRALYQKATGYDVIEEQAVKLKKGQHLEEVEVVQVRRHVPSDGASAIFWLKNRDRENWRDKQDVEHSLAPDLASAIAAGRARVAKMNEGGE